MNTWSFYDPETGRFSGKRFVGLALRLARNTPPGLVPMLGAFDAVTCVVNLETGAVTPREPDAPAAGTLARDARADRNRRLATTDLAVMRALERGEPVPQALITYRAALRDLPDQAGFPWVIEWPDLANLG